jgi:hypothetical protein
MRHAITAFLLALALTGVPGDAGATAQEPDRLQLDGDVVALNTNPLSPWLRDHPDALPEPDVVSSSRWRGYVATWAIRDDRLWLTRVEMELDEPGGDVGETEEEDPVLDFDASTHDVLPRLFAGRHEVVAEWYTGTLIVPRGELVDYVHMGYGSTYEHYVVIVVDRGQVMSRQDLDAEGFIALRKRRFEAFRQTPAYRAEMDRIAANYPDWAEADADDFLFDYFSEQYLSVPEDVAP